MTPTSDPHQAPSARVEGKAMLQTRLEDHVLTLTLDHPPVNAFNATLTRALQKALRRAAADKAVRAVVLTGNGKVFSAGQDLREMRAGVEAAISYRRHLQETYNPLILQLRALPKPVIAALNGPVAGAGLGIALACDLRVAVPQAQLTIGFNGIGLAPDSGVSLLLPALIGLGRATELTFTNRPLSAEEALGWGLINRIFPPERFAAETEALARQLAHGPLHAYGLTKRAFNHAVLPGLAAALDYEGHLQEIARPHPEHREGVQAFLEKRAPNFLRDGQ